MTDIKKHYVCLGGCGGVSDHPGVCQAVDCENHNHQLVECDCVDGLHYDFDFDLFNNHAKPESE